MPVQSGSVTFARFVVEGAPSKGADQKRWLLRGLKRKAFTPLDPRRAEEDRAAGFVALEDEEAAAADSDVLRGEWALFAWRVDAIKVPAAAVKAQLERWAAGYAAEKGRPPTKREKRDRKEALRQALRQKAEPVTRVHDLSWNLGAGQLLVWAASRKAVDEIAAAIEEAFEVALQPVTPGAVAAREGLPEAALGPTAALVGLQVKEVTRGEA